MGTLYIDRQGCELRWRDGALDVREPDTAPRSVPAALLQRVVLRANTLVHSTTLAALAEQGVAVVAFGGRGGQRVAHVLGAGHNDCRARVAQCLRLGDEAWATAWCRRLVHTRLRSQWRLLHQARQQRPDLRKPLTDGCNRLQTSLQALPAADNRDSLRGLEGAGAAAFFAAYAHLFAPALQFNARRRRPPPDPVNACLSLGYTLLQARAVQACWQAGLDPLVGFLHRPSHGRASLACDLMEPWRAQIERWVWHLWRDRVLRAEHFGRDGAQACLLGKAGRAHFYALAHPLLAHCQRGLQRQARLLARELANGLGPQLWPGLDDDAWEADDNSSTATTALLVEEPAPVATAIPAPERGAP